MMFQVGDEWSDGWGNYIVVASTADTITTHDWEGVISTETHASWQTAIDTIPLSPVTKPSLEERLAAWRATWPNFPL